MLQVTKVVHPMSVRNKRVHTHAGRHHQTSGPQNFWCSDVKDGSIPEQTHNIGSTVDQEGWVSRLPADPGSPRDAGNGTILGYGQPTQFA